MKKWEEEQRKKAHNRKVVGAKATLKTQQASLSASRGSQAGLTPVLASSGPISTSGDNRSQATAGTVFERDYAISQAANTQYQRGLTSAGSLMNSGGIPSLPPGSSQSSSRRKTTTKMGSAGSMNTTNKQDQNSIRQQQRKNALNSLGDRAITDLPIYQLLRAFNLQQYARKLAEQGYADDVYKLTVLNSKQRNDLISQLKCVPGHNAKMLGVFQVIDEIYPRQVVINQIKSVTPDKSGNKANKARIPSATRHRNPYGDAVRVQRQDPQPSNQKSLLAKYEQLDPFTKREFNQMFVQTLEQARAGFQSLNQAQQNNSAGFDFNAAPQMYDLQTGIMSGYNVINEIFPPSMFSYGEDVIDQMNQKDVHSDIQAAMNKFYTQKQASGDNQSQTSAQNNKDLSSNHQTNKQQEYADAVNDSVKESARESVSSDQHALTIQVDDLPSHLQVSSTTQHMMTNTTLNRLKQQIGQQQSSGQKPATMIADSDVGIDFQNFSALDPNCVDPLLEDSQNLDDAIAILNIKDPKELATTLKQQYQQSRQKSQNQIQTQKSDDSRPVQKSLDVSKPVQDISEIEDEEEDMEDDLDENYEDEQFDDLAIHQDPSKTKVDELQKSSANASMQSIQMQIQQVSCDHPPSSNQRQSSTEFEIQESQGGNGAAHLQETPASAIQQARAGRRAEDPLSVEDSIISQSRDDDSDDDNEPAEPSPNSTVLPLQVQQKQLIAPKREKPSSPLLDKEERDEAWAGGNSFDAKRITEALGFLDMKQICYCLAQCLNKHLRFSQGFLFLTDLQEFKKEYLDQSELKNEQLEFTYNLGDLKGSKFTQLQPQNQPKKDKQMTQKNVNEEFEKIKAAIQKTQETPISAQSKESDLEQVDLDNAAKIKDPEKFAMKRNTTEQDLIEDFYEDQLAETNNKTTKLAHQSIEDQKQASFQFAPQRPIHTAEQNKQSQAVGAADCNISSVQNNTKVNLTQPLLTNENFTVEDQDKEGDEEECSDYDYSQTHLDEFLRSQSNTLAGQGHAGQLQSGQLLHSFMSTVNKVNRQGSVSNKGGNSSRASTQQNQAQNLVLLSERKQLSQATNQAPAIVELHKEESEQSSQQVVDQKPQRLLDSPSSYDNNQHRRKYGNSADYEGDEDSEEPFGRSDDERVNLDSLTIEKKQKTKTHPWEQQPDPNQMKILSDESLQEVAVRGAIKVDMRTRDGLREALEFQMRVFDYSYDFETDQLGASPDDEIQPQNPTIEELYYYCKYVIITGRMEKEIPILCLIYLERFTQKTGLLLNWANWRRLVFICLVLASKVWDDDSLENVHFPQVMSEVTLKEISGLEQVFLRFIDFELIIRGAEYAKYYFILKTFSKGFNSVLPMGPLDAYEMTKLVNNTTKAESDLREKYRVKLELQQTI